MAITHRAMVFIKKKNPNHLSTPTVTPSVIIGVKSGHVCSLYITSTITKRKDQ